MTGDVEIDRVDMVYRTIRTRSPGRCVTQKKVAIGEIGIVSMRLSHIVWLVWSSFSCPGRPGTYLGPSRLILKCTSGPHPSQQPLSLFPHPSQVGEPRLTSTLSPGSPRPRSYHRDPVVISTGSACRESVSDANPDADSALCVA